MKVGILGTGDVGKAIGRGFLALGHEVMLSGREASNPKAAEWAAAGGAQAHAGSFAQAAEWGELIVLATLGVANASAIALAGPAHFKGKVVWDTTNPLDFSGGFPPKLAKLTAPSAGEEVQALLPDALVVKVFNTVGNGLMFRPALIGGPPDMFIAGNDAAAKQQTTQLLVDFGWSTVDLGGISSAVYLEAMCVAWVLAASASGNWMQAFKLLKTN